MLLFSVISVSKEAENKQRGWQVIAYLRIKDFFHSDVLCLFKKTYQTFGMKFSNIVRHSPQKKIN